MANWTPATRAKQRRYRARKRGAQVPHWRPGRPCVDPWTEEEILEGVLAEVLERVAVVKGRRSPKLGLQQPGDSELWAVAAAIERYMDATVCYRDADTRD